MAGVSKRSKAGKYRFWYTDEAGVRRFGTGFTDRVRTQKLADEMEFHSRREREGLVETGHRHRQAAAAKPVAAHLDDYRLELVARGDSRPHVRQTVNAVRALLADAAVDTVADLSPERVQGALGRLAAAGKSPRTRNFALGALKGFARWLEDNNRIKEMPRGLARIEAASEKIGRRRERRAATIQEIERILLAARCGPDHHVYGPTRSKHHKTVITGPCREALYRLALGTGFRAKELRALLPEWFRLEGDSPEVVIPAAFTKNRQEARQPIARELAEGLRAFVERAEPGRPVLVVPDKTAKMLRADMAAAGIPYRDAAGRYLDFHALRHSFGTHLVRSGVNPKVVQKLMRHSTITLTMDRYAHADDDDMRQALEGGGPRKGGES